MKFLSFKSEIQLEIVLGFTPNFSARYLFVAKQYPSLQASDVIIAYNNFSFAFHSLLYKIVAGITE